MALPLTFSKLMEWSTTALVPYCHNTMYDPNLPSYIYTMVNMKRRTY
uniref:Uncharacterized protein n=1 Tax=Arundo donax TaxID=35708 RepID=A0A0A9DFT4_ARUDO